MACDILVVSRFILAPAHESAGAFWLRVETFTNANRFVFTALSKGAHFAAVTAVDPSAVSAR
jgi:hypothetical protein